jgi:hypothetical protein
VADIGSPIDGAPVLVPSCGFPYTAERFAVPAPGKARRMPSVLRPSTLARAHGTYLAISAAWPLLDMRTFKMLTGPSKDPALVRAYAALALGIGIAMLASSDRIPPALGASASAAIVAGDVIVASGSGRSAPHLADAALHLGIGSAWLAAARSRRR